MKMKKYMLKGILIITIILSLSTLSMAGDNCKAVYGNGPNKFTLATGSPGELGLLEQLAEVFNKQHTSTMCWKKAGSGASLKLLKAKKVDIVMVHAPAAEKKAVQEGWAIKRTLIGSNEFSPFFLSISAVREEVDSENRDSMKYLKT